jgi:hypothetical protein
VASPGRLEKFQPITKELKVIRDRFAKRYGQDALQKLDNDSGWCRILEWRC